MSLRLKGTLIGAAASLAGVALWIILGMLNFIAGIAGALMGVLFIIVYRKINPTDKSPYAIIVSVVLILAEILLSELIVLFIIASNAGVPFGFALSVAEVQRAVLLDVLMGLGLSAVVFVAYIVSARNKEKLAAKRAAEPVPEADAPSEANAGVFAEADAAASTTEGVASSEDTEETK